MLWHGIALGLSLPAHTGTERHRQGCYQLLETKTMKTMKTHVASHSAAIFTPTAYKSPSHVSTLSLEQDPPGTGRALAAGVLGVTDRGLPSLRAGPRRPAQQPALLTSKAFV